MKSSSTETPGPAGFRRVRVIAMREIVVAFRSRQVVLSAAAVILLYAASLAMSWQNWQAESTEVAHASEVVRTLWLEQGERNPHDAAHMGTFVFRPLQPLAILDPGLRAYSGRWVFLETHTQNSPGFRSAAESTLLFRMSDFSPAAVLFFLVPVFILLLTHGAIVGEREGGTLQLVRAGGVSPGALLAGKALGVGALVAVVMVPLLAASGAVVLYTADDPARAAILLGALGGGALLYYVAFILGGLGISAMSRTAGLALVLSLTAWVGVCVAAPRVVGSFAESLHPAPSAFQFKQMVEGARDRRWNVVYESRRNFQELYGEVEQTLMESRGVESASDLDLDPFGFTIEETEQDGQRAYDQTHGWLLATFRAQESVHRAGILLSPYTGMRALSRALADEDLAASDHFFRAAETHRRAMMSVLNLDIGHNARRDAVQQRTETGFVTSYTRGRDLWEEVPVFAYAARPSLRILDRHLPEFLLLALWVLATGAFAGAAVRRGMEDL